MSIKKLLISLFLFLIVICVIAYIPNVKITVYPRPSIPKWALVGSVSHKTLYCVFYPYEDRKIPLRNFDVLYTNDVEIYALTFTSKTSANITFYFYKEKEVKEGNITKTIQTDRQYVNYTMPLTRNRFTKLEVTLPTHETEYKAMIIADGKPILFFRHHSHPYYVYVPKKYTFGSLMSERLAYIFSSLIVCFVALGLSHKATQKLKVIPQINVWGAIYILTFAIAFIFYVTYEMIYLFGITNVLWSYPIIFICMFIFGFFLTRQPRRYMILRRAIDAQMPTVDLRIWKVVHVENEIYKADLGLREWLRNQPKKVVLKGNPRWKVVVKDSDSYEIYFKEIKEEEDKIIIEVEDIHLWDVEKYKSKIKTVTQIVKEKARLNKRVNELEAKFEVETDRKAREIFKAYQKIRAETLTFEEKPEEELEEEIKNE